jgi:hypothetical protein
VQLGLVRDHARQFDTKDPHRPAGSQEEFIAASYLLAHLQEAGYLVRLDAVPVANLIHSTNVIALPPSGRASTVIVVAYDTAMSAPSDGLALGTFLELARALEIVDPGHSVQFAALGAEHTSLNGGESGSRSLISILRKQRPSPQILRIGEVEARGAGISAAGPLAQAIRAEGARLHAKVFFDTGAPRDALTRGGFSETVVGGSVSLGRVLLAYLTTRSGS